MVDHALDQAVPEPVPAGPALDQQEPELRRRVGQPLDRDRSDEPAAALGHEDPVARRRERGHEVAERAHHVALEHWRISEFSDVDLAVAGDDVADRAGPRRADRDPVVVAAEERLQAARELVDHRSRLRCKPRIEPVIRAPIDRAELRPALRRDDDRP